MSGLVDHRPVWGAVDAELRVDSFPSERRGPGCLADLRAEASRAARRPLERDGEDAGLVRPAPARAAATAPRPLAESRLR
ncbi:hypothetical protein [Streptomyces fradiae]|uniref:hypothetical protein n=1 Tax=Streptomyces fradiae TaxID=1906 RepID=UPI003986AE57